MQVTGKEVPHDPSWPLPLQVYVVIHFLLVLRTYHDLFENKTVRICHIRKDLCCLKHLDFTAEGGKGSFVPYFSAL